MSAFRDARPRRLSGTVEYGPFSALTRRIVPSLMFVVVSLGLAAFSVDRERIECGYDRWCTFTRPLLVRQLEVSVDALTSVTVQRRVASKGRLYGVVVFTFADGSQHATMGIDPDRASAAAAEIKARLAFGEPVDVTLHGQRWGLVGAGFLLVMAALTSLRALRRSGRVRLEILRDGEMLGVTHTILGVKVDEGAIRLDDVIDVAIDRGVVDEGLARGEAPRPGARLVLVSALGERRFVTEGFFPGVSAHLRAAAELRALLELAPGAIEAERAADTPRATPYVTRALAVAGALLYGGYVGFVLGALLAAALDVGFEGARALAWAVTSCGAITGFVFAVRRTRPRLR